MMEFAEAQLAPGKVLPVLLHHKAPHHCTHDIKHPCKTIPVVRSVGQNPGQWL